MNTKISLLLLALCLGLQSAPFSAHATDLSWSQWRGPTRDGMIKEGAPWPKSISKKKLKLSWRKEIAKGYHNFHVEQQKRHASREWDLNDPEKLKTEVPPRMGDTPLGPSSLQVFDGEDPRAGARQALQLKQQAEWHKAQCDEKRAARELEKLDQKDLAVTLENQERVMMDVSRDERDLRRAKAIETAKANLALAKEKRDREANEKSRTLAANEAEIRSVQGSNMMTENPGVGVNAGQPHRYRTDHWKGMSQSQLNHISHFQNLQVQENQARRQAEQHEEALLGLGPDGPLALAEWHEAREGQRGGEEAEREAGERLGSPG